MKEGKKPEHSENTPDDELQERPPHTKAQKFKPQSRLEPTLQHWWQVFAMKADVLTTTPRVVLLECLCIVTTIINCSSSTTTTTIAIITLLSSQSAGKRRKGKPAAPSHLSYREGKSLIRDNKKRKPSSTAKPEDTTQTWTHFISCHDTNRPPSFASEQVTAD